MVTVALMYVSYSCNSDSLADCLFVYLFILGFSVLIDFVMLIISGGHEVQG